MLANNGDSQECVHLLGVINSVVCWVVLECALSWRLFPHPLLLTEKQTCVYLVTLYGTECFRLDFQNVLFWFYSGGPWNQHPVANGVDYIQPNWSKPMLYISCLIIVLMCVKATEMFNQTFQSSLYPKIGYMMLVVFKIVPLSLQVGLHFYFNGYALRSVCYKATTCGVLCVCVACLSPPERERMLIREWKPWSCSNDTVI